VAWERPDAFRRVLSTIGTYAGVRGGNEYPTLIRKTEPKPIRVFLQDGSRDLNLYGGDWWIANQAIPQPHAASELAEETSAALSAGDGTRVRLNSGLRRSSRSKSQFAPALLRGSRSR
jgi:hypothetical protein